MASVVCAGVATADLVFRMKRTPDRPIKYRAEDSALIAGGCALNAAVAVARLGGDARLSAAVGTDAFASTILEDMAAEGVATDLFVRLDGISTARSAVIVGDDGERMIVNYRDRRLFEATPELPPTFPFDGALADTRWPAGATAVLRAARSAGRPAVLDAEAPVSSDALAAATHVAFSEQGLADWAGVGDQTAALAKAASLFGAWVCVTRGPTSVLVHDGTGLSEVPAFEVVAVDTLGAGDAWHGAFALFLSEGQPPSRAVRHANAVAAMKASASGRSGLPTRPQLETFLKERS